MTTEVPSEPRKAPSTDALQELTQHGGVLLDATSPWVWARSGHARWLACCGTAMQRRHTGHAETDSNPELGSPPTSTRPDSGLVDPDSGLVDVVDNAGCSRLELRAPHRSRILTPCPSFPWRDRMNSMWQGLRQPGFFQR